jgi:hypothetical protein
MAWTNIDNALVSVGALPFATTIQALRDNPIAIANGDAGAPQIQTAALISGERMNTGNVLGATAAASVGAIGTYALLKNVTASTNVSPGETLAASNLRYVNAAGDGDISVTSGTWRAMGRAFAGATSGQGTTVWLRIS